MRNLSCLISDSSSIYLAPSPSCQNFWTVKLEKKNLFITCGQLWLWLKTHPEKAFLNLTVSFWTVVILRPVDSLRSSELCKHGSQSSFSVDSALSSYLTFTIILEFPQTHSDSLEWIQNLRKYFFSKGKWLSLWDCFLSASIGLQQPPISGISLSGLWSKRLFSARFTAFSLLNH